MAGEVRLKVSRASYEAKINDLKGLITQLDAAITSYGNAETRLDSFMSSSDDSYEKTREAIRTNVNTVKQAKAQCEAAIQSLEKTLNEMESFGENVANMIGAGAEAAKSGVKTAFDVMNLVN